jgi:hypothetical protein
MMQFYKFTFNKHTTYETITKRLSHIPSQILDSLVRTFTESSQESSGDAIQQHISMPDKLKDKLLGYIFATALLLNDFKVQTTQLASDLSIKPEKAALVCKELGCRIDVRKVDGSEVKTASLVVPLTFPVRRR